MGLQRWVLWAAALAVLGACSAASDTSGSGRGGTTSVLGAPKVTGQGGTGSGAAATGASNGFGNTQTPAAPTTAHPAPAGQLVSDGGPCVVGQFCAPTGADMGCGTLTLASTVKMTTNPGNVLLIFDRSLSMNDQWNGMPKWQAAGTAVINALQPLANLLTIGAELFPSPNSSGGGCIDPTGITCAILGGDPTQFCNVNPITAPDEVAFKPGPQAIMELMTGSNGAPKYQPVGATPTAEAVKMSDMALSSATLTGPIVAIIITDGEPNCMWDQNATITTITNWLNQKQIKTYVVGLPGAGMGNGPMVLTALAQAGGTMDYFTPDDSMKLQMKLQEVVSQVVSSGFDSCSIDLMPPTSSPDKLQLVVEEAAMKGMLEMVPHDLGGTAGGWTISADGSHVDLTGGVCNSAKAGTFSQLTFQFGCK
ncbi:MAG: hypothetical protein ACHQ53_07035, partial [Polyangiales bacterium]